VLRVVLIWLIHSIQPSKSNNSIRIRQRIGINLPFCNWVFGVPRYLASEIISIFSTIINNLNWLRHIISNNAIEAHDNEETN